MGDRRSFDALDMLAAALGAALSFAVLAGSADSDSAKLVVVVCVAAVVAMKRLFISTRTRSPNAVRRVVYLIIAFSGIACLGLALLAMFAGVDELAGAATYLLWGGLALLILAALIERDWRKPQD